MQPTQRLRAYLERMGDLPNDWVIMGSGGEDGRPLVQLLLGDLRELAGCGHNLWAGIHCAEMSCWNYVGKEYQPRERSHI